MQIIVYWSSDMFSGLAGKSLTFTGSNIKGLTGLTDCRLLIVADSGAFLF